MLGFYLAGHRITSRLQTSDPMLVHVSLRRSLYLYRSKRILAFSFPLPIFKTTCQNYATFEPTAMQTFKTFAWILLLGSHTINADMLAHLHDVRPPSPYTRNNQAPLPRLFKRSDFPGKSRPPFGNPRPILGDRLLPGKSRKLGCR